MLWKRGKDSNKGREQSVTQAVFVQTLTVRLSVSSAPLMNRVCPAVPGKAFPVPISLAAHPAFSGSTKIQLPRPMAPPARGLCAKSRQGILRSCACLSLFSYL